MAAILVFFCFNANWPLRPRLRLNILLNFTFESQAIRANLHGNKSILKWRPFWNKVYYCYELSTLNMVTLLLRYISVGLPQK